MPFRPPTPGWFGQVNFIVGWFMQSCDVPLTVYVQFAAEPTVEVALMLVTLDPADLVKEWARPKGLRTARHGRKGKRGTKDVFTLLDVDELVAHNIAGHEEFRGRPFGSATFWAFEITDVIDRVSWTFACVDGITEIGYKTLIGIIQADKNNCPQLGRMFRTDGFASILNTGNNFAPVSVEDLQWINKIDSPHGFQADMLDDGHYLVTLEWGTRPIVPSTVQVGIAIVDSTSQEVLNQYGPFPITYPERHVMSVDAIVIGPGGIRPGVMSDGDFTQLDTMKWLITQIS
jgi:hypothetical protein